MLRLASALRTHRPRPQPELAERPRRRHGDPLIAPPTSPERRNWRPSVHLVQAFEPLFFSSVEGALERKKRRPVGLGQVAERWNWT